jgi:hypothetical protein
MREFEQTLKAVQKLLEDHGRRVDRLEERVGGERGLSAALNELTKEVKHLREWFSGEIHSFRRMAYWVMGVIIVGCIGFAFSVLERLA